MTTRTDSIDGLKDDAKDAISKPIEKLTNAVADTAHAAGDKARATVDKGREILGQGRDAVSNLGAATQDYVSRNADDVYRGARDTASKVGSSTAAFVRDRPMSALAIAAGIGVIGALLLNRRRR